MKSLGGSLLATLLGTAMLVVGIAGVAGGFDSDDDDGGGSSDTSTEITSDCPTDDPRFEGIETFDVKDGGLLVVTCRSGSYEATYGRYSDVVTEPQTLALWLARGKKRYALVAAEPLTYGDSVGVTGTLPSNTTRYNRWIISREPERKTSPKKPTKIVEQVKF